MKIDKKKVKKYALLGADNVGEEIKVEICDTYEEAYAAMETTYKNFLDFCKEEDAEVERSSIDENSCSILLINDDFYYCNIKEIYI